jgi:hypothetical protein
MLMKHHHQVGMKKRRSDQKKLHTGINGKSAMSKSTSAADLFGGRANGEWSCKLDLQWQMSNEQYAQTKQTTNLESPSTALKVKVTALTIAPS